MAKTLVESNEFTADITVPEGGDARTAASIEPAFQRLTNRSKFLKERIPGVAASYRVEIPLAVIQNTNGRFTGNGSGWFQSDVTSGGPLYIVIPRFPEGKIDELHVLVAGGVGHAGLPGTKPSIGLFRWNATPGDPAVGSSYAGVVGGVYQSDPSASVAAYEAVHLISQTGLNYTPDANELIQLVIWGESGANALANQFRAVRAWMIVKE